MTVKQKPRLKIILLVAAGAVVLIALIAGIIVWQVVDWDKNNNGSGDEYYLEPSESELGIFSQAAISSDSPVCSGIARDTLKKGGTVADAAIAAMLCVGLIQGQSMGLGGGFLAVYYDASTNTSTALNARDKAPLKATQDMFEDKPSNASMRGALSVAVPGELKGYWELWSKYGKLDWKDLFKPTINLARNGFEITAHAAKALSSNSQLIKSFKHLSQVYVNNATGEVYKLGDTIKRPTYANTLEEIANNGDILYQDTELMKKFVKDLVDEGGIMTEQDMLEYDAPWKSTIQLDIAGGYKLHSVPPPGSGVLIAFFMKLLGQYPNRSDSLVTYQRLIEAFKHGYAKRSILGDPADTNITNQVEELCKNLTDTNYIENIIKLIHDDTTSNDTEYYGAEFYQPEDHGTAHLSIIGPNGDAIGITSTINFYFGSMLLSPQTGIIYNDGMDDFSSPHKENGYNIPPSKNNFIRPGKRPVSSMAPTIITDKNNKVRLVVGGSGGPKITTAVTMVSVRNLWFGENIKEAIDARRLHHQLYPMEIQYEKGFNPRIVEGLEQLGHQTEEFAVGTSMVQGISVLANGTIYANADFRKEGTVAGY